MPIISDIVSSVGYTFGSWKVLAYAGRPFDISSAHAAWCKCGCGTVKIVSWNAIREGRSNGCGCKCNKNCAVDNINKSVGTKINRWEILAYAGTSVKTPTLHYVWCRCVCGKIKKVLIMHIRSGKSSGCGCFKNTRGGKSNTPEYVNWYSMIIRTEDTGSNTKSSMRYRAKGVKVCDRWLNSFSDFLSDVGPRPGREYTLDRIDNNGDYTPENVRWATRAEQSRNTSRNVKVTINGITKCAAEWAREYGISPRTVYGRLNAGWEPKVAVTTPLGRREIKKKRRRNVLEELKANRAAQK